MRLSITASLCAALLMLATGAGGQEPLAAPAGGGLTLQTIPGTAPAANPTIPGGALTAPSGQANAPYPMIDPCCAGIGEPAYYFSADTLFWTLRQGVDQPLALRARDDSVAFRTGAIDYGWEPGARMRAAYNTEEGTNFEAEYFGIYTWQAENSVFDNGPGLRLPGDLGLPAFSANYSTGAFAFAGPPAVARASQTYQMNFFSDATINSIEANLAFGQKRSEVKYMLGIRYVKFDERFQISSTSNVVDAITPPLGGAGLVSRYNIDARNDAFGINLGARFRREYASGVKLEMVGKVAVMSNTARQSQFVGDYNDRIILRDTGGERSVTALLSEYNFSAIFPISQRWSFRTGYNVAWLTGIARASDQLDFHVNTAAGSGVQIREGALMHGFHTGLEALW